MNENLFLLINQFAGKNHVLDLIGIFLAKDMPYVFILVEIYLYFIIDKKNESLFAFYSVILALMISFSISLIYFHNRPFMDNIGTLLIHHKAETSFPSDHTTFLFSIACSFMLFRIRFWGLFLFLALLGGLARIYVGVHYPYDILGGIVVGFVGAFIIFKCKTKLQHLNEIIFSIENKLLRKNND